VDFTISADKVGLVAQPGVTLTSTATTSTNIVTVSIANFDWLEVNLDATPGTATPHTAVYLHRAHFNTLRGVRLVNGSQLYDGIFTDGTSQSNRIMEANLEGVSAYSPIGLQANGHNLIYDVRMDNGDEIYENSLDNHFGNVVIGNNYYGGEFDASNTVVAGLTATNNSKYGLWFSSGNVAMNVTAANNDLNGAFDQGTGDTLAGIVAVNTNTASGFYTTENNGTYADIASANNSNTSGYGIVANGTNDTFTGKLEVGHNNGGDAGLDCVAGGTNPGIDNNCAEQGSSDFGTPVTGVDLTSSFVGKVTTDDTVNTSDSSGTATYADALDWSHFENPYRAWGLDGSAFPNVDQADWCSSGTCRIWDWSLSASDTYLRNVRPLPTGNDTLTHTWYMGTAPTAQSDCDAAVPGSTFVAGTPNTCQSTFLRNAVELIGDGVGNENLLCESGEVCLYSPNIGSYQGHGKLVSAGTFTDGTLTGITLVKYDTNGY
jgi:hypothetical protein